MIPSLQRLVIIAMNKHLRVLAVLLALAAIGGLVGIGTHAHANDADHSDCWLCISSVATLAVPATVGVFLLYWIFIARIVAAEVNPPSISSTLNLHPRAPPVRLPI